MLSRLKLYVTSFAHTFWGIGVHDQGHQLDLLQSRAQIR